VWAITVGPDFENKTLGLSEPARYTLLITLVLESGPIAYIH